MFGPMRIARRRICPHEEIKDCPLYVASHDCRGLGCVTDDLMECEVTKGRMDYQRAVLRMQRWDA